MSGLHDDVDNDSLYAFFQSIACPATEVYKKIITNAYTDASMCLSTQCLCVFVGACERVWVYVYVTYIWYYNC